MSETPTRPFTWRRWCGVCGRSWLLSPAEAGRQIIRGEAVLCCGSKTVCFGGDPNPLPRLHGEPPCTSPPPTTDS